MTEENVSVVFGAQIGNLVSGVHQVKEELAGIADTTLGVMNTFTEFGKLFVEIFAVEQIQSFVEHITDLGVQIERTSQQLGVSTEKVGELNAAAKFSDTSLEGMRNSMARFDLISQEAVKGTGNGAAAFQTLGIHIRDANGKIKDSQELLVEISEKFKNTADDTNKTALAMALFGRQGKDLIPILNLGRSGLQQMNDVAIETGTLFSRNLVEAMHETHDEIVTLDLAQQGLKNTIFLGIKPAFDLAEKAAIDFVESLTKAIKESDDLQESVNALILLMKSFETGVIVMAKGLETTFMTVQSGLGALNQYLSGNKEEGDAIWRSYTNDIVKMWDGVDDKIKNVWKDAAVKIPEAETHKKTAGSLGDVLAEKEKIKEIEKIQKKAIEEQTRSWDHFFTSFNSGLKGMITGTMNWATALRSITLNLIMNFIKEKELELAHHIAVEHVKTAATVAGAAERAAAEKTAATTNNSIFSAAAQKAIMTDAAKAYSGTYGFLAPVMGPFAAVPAAASFAAVMAMDEFIPSFDVGTWNVPHDMTANLHAGERVMTAEENRSYSANGGGGQPITMNFNGPTDKQYFMSNAHHIAAALGVAGRNFNPALTKARQ